MSEDPFEGSKETEIRQGDKVIRVTIEDIKQIRAALLDALQISKLGDRDTLIAFTKPLPGWIDSDGRAMAGGWQLHINNNELVASYRLSTNEHRAVGFAASIVKAGNAWKVSRIEPERISFRE